MIYPISEIKQTSVVEEANTLLKENWLLLKISNNQKGIVYVLGKKSPGKNKANA